MMITDPRFRQIWEEVNYLLDRRDEADGTADEIVDLILWDRDRRRNEAREAMEDAAALAADWDAYNRRIA